MVAAFLTFHFSLFRSPTLRTFFYFHSFSRQKILSHIFLNPRKLFNFFFLSCRPLEKFHSVRLENSSPCRAAKKYFSCRSRFDCLPLTILSNQQKVLKFRIACCSDGFVVAAAAVLLPFSLSVELWFFINLSPALRAARSSSSQTRSAQERAKNL
jgi:hypothetical protein